MPMIPSPLGPNRPGGVWGSNTSFGAPLLRVRGIAGLSPLVGAFRQSKMGFDAIGIKLFDRREILLTLRSCDSSYRIALLNLQLTPAQLLFTPGLPLSGPGEIGILPALVASPDVPTENAD